MTKGVWCALILVLMGGAPLSAQSNTSSGAITGTVRDSSGAVVAGAKITVDNESRAISRSVMTDDRGEFHASEPLPVQLPFQFLALTDS